MRVANDRETNRALFGSPTTPNDREMNTAALGCTVLLGMATLGTAIPAIVLHNIFLGIVSGLCAVVTGVTGRASGFFCCHPSDDSDDEQAATLPLNPNEMLSKA